MSQRLSSVDRSGDAARLFDGERLTLARQLAGLRKNGLAEAVGKTPTAIAAYESGSMRPATQTVARLCLALGVEPEFFMAGLPRYGSLHGVPHFRSLRSTTQVVRDQAYALGQLAVSVAATLERHVELPAVDVPHFPVAVDDASDVVVEAAQLLRQAWSVPPGPLRHAVRLAEDHGVLVLFAAGQTTSVDAYSFDNAHRPIILLNPLKRDYYRQRFDVAHELGHLVMHTDAEPGDKRVEDQAHCFAAELLLPAAEVAPLLPAKADWTALGHLKATWGVSLQALLFRAKQLGAMTHVTYRNAMTTVSARGWRRREPGAQPGIEQPSLLARAVELLAEEGTSWEQVAAEARVPPGLFRLVTARTPTSDSEREGRLDPEPDHEVVSLLTLAR